MWIGKHAKGRRSDLLFLQQFPGKRFTGFQLGSLAGRSEDAQPLGLKGINDSQAEGNFRPDDRQVNPFLPGKMAQASNIFWFHVYQFRHLTNAGVARRAVYLGDQATLANFPDQGVLTTTRSNHQDVLLCHKFSDENGAGRQKSWPCHARRLRQ